MKLLVSDVFRQNWNSKFRISLFILILQIIGIIDLMILIDLASPSISVINPNSLLIFDTTVTLLLSVLNARFIYFFFSKRSFFGYLIIMISGFLLNAIAIGIPVSDQYTSGQLFLIIFSTILSFFPPLTAMIYILFDSLQEKDDKIYRLVGAANLFILFPIIFGGLLFFLELLHPMISEIKFASLMEASYFYVKLSFYGATGFEAPVENINILLKNALTIESFFMDLFALLMLGRLVEK